MYPGMRKRVTSSTHTKRGGAVTLTFDLSHCLEIAMAIVDDSQQLGKIAKGFKL
jgi:hypothetical protein